jgi:uncharacterized Zn-binding protein involved in type VI secretion
MPGQPAARVTDKHTCPAVTGLVPHVGGPVLPPGAATVQTTLKPNARVLDLATCAGGPDAIAQGCSTVLINGLPATRQLDTTSHGGKVVTGEATVLIGEPVVTLNVKVKKGDKTFVTQLQKALEQLLPTRSGVEWLNQVGRSGKKITFRRTKDANGYCEPTDPANAGNGVGSDSIITWNPNHGSTDPSTPGPQGSPGPAVVLAHEMVHALHNATGADKNGPYDHFPGQEGSSSRNEERGTVGTSGPITVPGGASSTAPDYSHDVPTENSFRDDLGIPRRRTYYPSNWPGGAPW